jgi:hypothetical protein
MNKRDFVLGGATTLTAGVMLPARADAAQPSVGANHSQLDGSTARRLARWPDLASRPDLDTWRHYVGESFGQAVPGERGLVLRRVDQQHPDEQGEQFSLVFAPEAGAKRQSGTHQLRHAATGQQIAVYLQAAGHDADGRALLRADFNRLT